MPPVAVKSHKIEVKNHKICRTCCAGWCPDPNGCMSMPHKWSVELTGTPWDGIYEARLTNCGCAECPDMACADGRTGGSSWEYFGSGFAVGIHWQCLPAPAGQYWAVIVTFMHEGHSRQCWVKLPGGSNPCAPEGLYDDNLCGAEGSDDECWTEWCSAFYAEVSAVGEMLLASTLQPDGKGGCRSCRGLA